MVQQVLLELACKKMDLVMGPFLLQLTVIGPKMVGYLVVVQEVQDFLEFQEFQVDLDCQVGLGHLLLLFAQIVLLFQMIQMSLQEFHLGVGYSFLVNQVYLVQPIIENEVFFILGELHTFKL